MKKYKITYRWYSKSKKSFFECEIILDEESGLNFINNVPWEITNVEVIEE